MPSLDKMIPSRLSPSYLIMEWLPSDMLRPRCLLIACTRPRSTQLIAITCARSYSRCQHLDRIWGLPWERRILDLWERECSFYVRFRIASYVVLPDCMDRPISRRFCTLRIIRMIGGSKDMQWVGVYHVSVILMVSLRIKVAILWYVFRPFALLIWITVNSQAFGLVAHGFDHHWSMAISDQFIWRLYGPPACYLVRPFRLVSLGWISSSSGQVVQGELIARVYPSQTIFRDSCKLRSA